MYTIEDKSNIKKYLKDGNYGEIILICMMRNGATIDELQEMDSVIHSTDAHAINTTIKYVMKYMNLNEVMNDDYH